MQNKLQIMENTKQNYRIAMGVEYDGSPYIGWQSQREGETVQQNVERALSKVANQPINIFCAGRTDTGVHANEQVIHFETTAYRNVRSWVMGTNTNLPRSISILWASPVPETFHARFSAIKRAYRYTILNRGVRPAILNNYVSFVHRSLDETRMQQAAQHLIGTHDFTSYRAVACQAKSPIRTLYKLDVSRAGEFVYLDLLADGFLHHMVRNIAGVLIKIGSGEAEIDWSKQVLEHRDRRLGGVTAAPKGLSLKQITYPDEFALPSIYNPP